MARKYGSLFDRPQFERAVVTFYVPKSLKDQLMEIAEEKNVSLSNFLRDMAQKHIDKELTKN